MYLVAVVMMNALFALAMPFGKLALQYTDAFFLTALRMVFASAFLSIYAVLSKQAWKKIDHADYGLFVKTTVYYMFLAFVPEAWALGYISSMKANMMWAALPFMTALMSYYIVRERLTNRKIIGMIIGALGTIPILLTSDETTLPIGEFFRISLPEFMMLVAIASTAYGWFLVHELDDRGYPLTQINACAMAGAGILSAITSCGFGYYHVDALLEWKSIIGYALIIAVLGNLTANVLYGWLLRYYTATFLSFSSFLAPIFGVIYGVLFMHELFYYRYVMAFIVIVTGLAVFYQDELQAQIQFRAEHE